MDARFSSRYSQGKINRCWSNVISQPQAVDEPDSSIDDALVRHEGVDETDSRIAVISRENTDAATTLAVTSRPSIGGGHVEDVARSWKKHYLHCHCHITSVLFAFSWSRLEPHKSLTSLRQFCSGSEVPQLVTRLCIICQCMMNIVLSENAVSIFRVCYERLGTKHWALRDSEDQCSHARCTATDVHGRTRVKPGKRTVSGGSRNLEWGRRTSPPLSPALLFFLSSPPISLSFSPSLSLEVGPLNLVRVSEEGCKLP